MCRLFLVTWACLAILFGSFGFYMMPKLIQQKIEQRMQLKINTKTYDRFTRIPIPLTVKFYIFNITNGERVLAGAEKPQFQEVGPFVYQQWRRRDVVDIIDNSRKIVYREYKTFYSSWTSLVPPDERNSSSWRVPNDPNNATILNPNAHQVTMVNLPLLSVLTQLAQLEEGTIKRGVASRVVSRLAGEAGEKILVNKPVNELLFDGYKVNLMESATDLISNTFGYNFESPLPKNRFGFFYGKNGTWSRREAGEMTVFTGRNDSMNDFMLVDNWNGLKQLNVWPRTSEAGNRCNEIRGTDGSQFHPGVTREQTLDIFSPLICSSIYVKYKEDTSVRGIPLLRFTTPPDVFAAPKKSPRNSCYCTIQSSSPSSSGHHMGSYRKWQPSSTSSLSNSNNKQTHSKQRARITDSRCYIDGLMDLSLCQRGAPIAASTPHFYNADPMLALATDLKPQKHLHETFLDIEPMTGAVFRAASRAQLNALVEQAALEVLDSQLIGNMTAMVAPLLWLEESAEIDEKSSLDFKGQLMNAMNKARRTFFAAITLGIVMLLVIGVQYWYVTCYKIDTAASFRKRKQDSERRRGLVSKRDETAPRRRGDRMSENLLIRPLVADFDGQKQAGNDGLATGTMAVVAAAVMGAADGAVTANQRARRDRERHRTRRAAYEHDQIADGQQDDDDEDYDDQLSKRGLVDSEWALGGTTNQSTSSSGANSSPVESTADSPNPPAGVEDSEPASRQF